MLGLRDWSRSGGSYGNNSRVICCPAPARPGSAARGTSPTVINPDYNMTKQRCIKNIYDKIRSKWPNVTHPSSTTGVVALHIPSWRVGVREERRQTRITVWPVNAGRVICHYQNNLCGIINHHKYNREFFFGCISRRLKHNHNEPYRHWCQDSGWHAHSIVTYATAWRR